MYFKSPNRGLKVTVLGIYLIVLAIAVGAIAVATGVNGMFLFLGLTLGLFSISGLLSERNIKYTVLDEPQQLQFLDRGSKHSLVTRIRNESRKNDVYGLELSLTVVEPRRRLFRLQSEIVGRFFCPSLNKKSVEKISFVCQFSRRGEYPNLWVKHDTTFPFGIFSKYKIQKLDCAITIVPAKREDLLEVWNKTLRMLASRNFGNEEFSGHNKFTLADPVKLLDWKKNAGKQPSSWVIKKFVQQNSTQRVALVVGHKDLSSLSDDSFERLLENLRTGLHACQQLQFFPMIFWGDACFAKGQVDALALLARWHKGQRPDEIDMGKDSEIYGQILVTSDRVEVEQNAS
ncbi:MAG: hypothetical protein HRU19_24365 [Pseudobacteriovorax sp.]|nr:hypothetical protein [Pseudobacteriovorax sp.]